MANTSTKEYEVHVICGPEVYDTRKKIDLEPFAFIPSLSEVWGVERYVDHLQDELVHVLWRDEMKRCFGICGSKG